MDHLPPELNAKLSSYLSLNHLARCRLVSHGFKVWAEARMQDIIHLKLRGRDDELYKPRRDWSETVEDEMKESYLQRAFFSKQFVAARGRWYGGQSLPAFYAFLGKFCPMF